MPHGAISHEAFLAASAAVTTLADVERLSRDSSLGLSYEALFSILSHRVDTEVKANAGYHRRPEVAAQYVRRFQRGESLTDIAAAVRFPPSMLARVVLESHLGVRKGKEVGQFLKNPALLTDARLQREVVAAIDADPHCGPNCDAVRRCLGIEYEELLAQKLRAAGVPFLDEEALRLRGDAKTPDALLPVPLLVRGRAVHWIDSKATFGDPESHEDYRANQFASYLNRFDAGLVIYWFGYDSSIDTDPRIVLLDDLQPHDCELMTCALTGDSAQSRRRRHRTGFSEHAGQCEKE